MSVTKNSTVGELVAAQPALSRVFGKLGIDFCCGGNKSLNEVCRVKGLNVDSMLELLNANASRLTTPTVNIAAMSFAELTRHIEETHHAFIKKELPRLHPMIERIATKHRDGNPNLVQLEQVFAQFRSELVAHMDKEEQALFPLIRLLDQSANQFPAKKIKEAIQELENEHQQAGVALALMRQLTHGYFISPAACNTFRAVMHGLRELESDMHVHVHKENHVLFPRAIKAAQAQNQSA